MFKFLRKKRESDALYKKTIADTDFVVLDTELTGLNEFKDHIIAIGAIKMKGRTIRIGDIFYRTVSPTKAKFRKESIMIHEITPSELESCPKIEPILREFLEFSKNCIVIGHCVDIDLTFLKREIKDNLNTSYEPKAIDTLYLYKWLISRGVITKNNSEKNSLEDIATSLGVEVRALHDAASDAFITAQVFQKLLFYLGEQKIFTLEELINIGSVNQKNKQMILKKEAYQF